MKIAVVLRKPPVPVYTGLNLIIKNVLERISGGLRLKLFILDGEAFTDRPDTSYDLEVFTPPGGSPNGNSRICRYARYYGTDESRLQWLSERVAEYRPDRVVGFGYDLLGYFGLLETRAPKILDIVDSEVLVLWREIKRGMVRPYMWKHVAASIALARKYIGKCDLIITVSREDTENIRKISGSGNIHTIPNGVDYDFYCPDERVGKKEGQVVFTGSLSYPPNRQSILWFVRKCWEAVLKGKPGARLVIIGKNPEEDVKRELESYGNVEVIGFVQDIRDYIRASQVSVAPIISGSGIKNKILEAWALGLPVVSTPLGAKGLYGEDGRNILLADVPRSFSRQVVRLLEDGGLRERLGREGRANVMENFSWRKIADEFKRVIDNAR